MALVEVAVAEAEVGVVVALRRRSGKLRRRQAVGWLVAKEEEERRWSLVPSRRCLEGSKSIRIT